MLIRNEFEPYMAKDKNQPTVHNNHRLAGLMLAIGTAFAGLIVYSFVMQRHHSTELNALGENRVVRSIKSPALRGTITDRNGNILAVSRYLKVATFNPHAIYQPKRMGDENNWRKFCSCLKMKCAKNYKTPANNTLNLIRN